MSSAGEEANDQSCFAGGPAISADGRFVAFVSLASNLVSDDTNGEYDVFVHDRETGVTERVNVSSSGGQAGRGGDSPSLSADGRFVAFRSRAGNLVEDDRNGAQDVFVRDLQTGVTERVSTSSSGQEGTKSSAEPSISADGRFVGFKSAAPNLVRGDTNRVADIFVHNRVSGNTWRVSVNSTGAQADRTSYRPSISGNGRLVAFASFASNLVRGDGNEDHDVFVRDRKTHQTRRASVTSAGAEGRRGGHDPVISGNGRFVAFESYSLAYPGDRKREDVFVRDRWERKTRQVSVSSAGVPGNQHSESPTISADGRFVAFHSIATNLVDGDTNRASDVFVRGPLVVARVTPRRSPGRRSGRPGRRS